MQVNMGDARKRLHQVYMIPHKRVDPNNGESPHTPPGGLMEQAARQPHPTRWPRERTTAPPTRHRNVH